MSGFNISRFSTNINQKGTLQNNKFLVQIVEPSQVSNPERVRTLQFRASSINMPGVNLKLISTYRYGIGPEEKTAVNAEFSNISISFIEDKQNSIWKFFSAWIDSIFKFQPGSNGLASAGTTYLSLYKDNYISRAMKISIFDNEGNNVNTINLTKAYPISISNIDLSWADQSELMKITVGFTFKEWYFDGRPNFVDVAPPSQRGQTNRVVSTPNPAAPTPIPESQIYDRGEPSALTPIPDSQIYDR